MIIIEQRTTKGTLDRVLRDTQDRLSMEGRSFNPTVGGVGGSSGITSPVSKVVEAKKEEEPSTTEEEGFIHTVYPKTNKVFVKVRKSELDENGDPIFFNHLNYLDEKVEASMAIPLIDFDPSSGESLDSLVTRPVLVTVTNRGIATKARLQEFSGDDALLDVAITPMDFYHASKHPNGVREGLRIMGYAETQIDSLLGVGLTEEERGLSGVIRIDGEGYWDQAVEEDTERTIRVKNAIEAWTEKNLSQMKTKLCHNPVLAFSAR